MNEIARIEIPYRTVDEIKATIERVASMEARTALSAALGKRMEIEYRAWFAKREKNKRGWRSTNFWPRRIRSATSMTSFDAMGATVTIADPAMNQKVFGGPIKPVEGESITIPARPEAANRSPRTFGSELVFIPLNHFRTGQGGGKLVGMLVKRQPARGWSGVLGSVARGILARYGGIQKKAAKPKLEVYYWCLAGVWQAPDKKALPPEDRIVLALEDERTRFEARRLGVSGSNAVGLSAVASRVRAKGGRL